SHPRRAQTAQVGDDAGFQSALLHLGVIVTSPAPAPGCPCCAAGSGACRGKSRLAVPDAGAPAALVGEPARAHAWALTKYPDWRSGTRWRRRRPARRHQDGLSMTGGLSPTLMATRRGLRSSGLGTRTSRTPLVKLAWMLSGSIPSGSVSEREN